MEAIKKKMQAMKVEKDNLMDRCDACEQVCDAHFLSSIIICLLLLSLSVMPRCQDEARKD